jgi:hypothetical protein
MGQTLMVALVNSIHFCKKQHCGTRKGNYKRLPLQKTIILYFSNIFRNLRQESQTARLCAVSEKTPILLNHVLSKKYTTYKHYLCPLNNHRL